MTGIRVARIYRSVLGVALLLLTSTGTLSAAEVSAPEELARAICSEPRELTLVLEQRALEGSDELADEQVVVFRLLRGEAGSGEPGRAIWQTSTSFVGLLRPWPFWKADIACDPAHGRALVTVVGNRGVTALWLDVFAVPLDAREGDLQPLPERSAIPIVPKLGVPSMAHFKGRLSLESGGVGAVESELEEGALAVLIKPCAPEVAPVRLEVNLASGEVHRSTDEGGAPSKRRSRSEDSPRDSRTKGGS